jgi:hypothetical protein
MGSHRSTQRHWFSSGPGAKTVPVPSPRNDCVSNDMPGGTAHILADFVRADVSLLGNVV